jgi:hypothetical protein
MIERAIEEKPPVLLPGESSKQAAQRHLAPEIFVPTKLQKSILKVLEGRALTKDAIAAAVCKGEASRLYKPGGIKELKEHRLVIHKHGVGYYRPDAPPSEAIGLQ